MSQSCKSVRELIPLFPADLEERESSRVREHVASCAACAAEVAVYAAQAARFAEARSGRAKVDLFAGIQEKLARPEPARPTIKFPLAASLLLAAAAAAVTAALGLSFFTRAEAPKPPEPVAHLDAPKAPSAPEAPRMAVAPRAARPALRAPRRIFESEGAGVVFTAGDRELVPLDEEATIPETKKNSFVEPPAAHVNPKAGDEDRSLSF